MSSAKKLMGTTAVGGALAIEDVFSTYLYTGTGSAQTITNGIDLAGEGGLVWVKQRTGTIGHALTDTERGATYTLSTQSTSAQADRSLTYVSSFNSDGFSLGSGVGINANAAPYASWTWRKAPRWFDVVTYTGDGVAGRAISHNLGVEPGFIVVKSISSANNWAAYHKNLGATKGLLLNSSAAEFTSVSVWNDTSPTSLDFTVGTSSAVNSSGATYVAYLFAHDPLGPSGDGSDGLISCGSFTTDGSGLFNVDLGWEPQWILAKRSDSTGDWSMLDNMRGITDSSVARVWANLANAEGVLSGNYIKLTPTGFKGEANYFGTNGQVIYIAIRRGPMRQPTSGTEVFDVVKDTTTFAAGNVMNGNILTDMFLAKPLIGTAGYDPITSSRLTGNILRTSATFSEYTAGTAPIEFSRQTAVRFGVNWLTTAGDYLSYYFRRAPGFFDVVAYTGTNVARTVQHSLGVAPEFILIKNRSVAVNWIAYHAGAGTDKFLSLNTGGSATTSTSVWQNTAPTSTEFYIGTGSGLNNSANNYIAYLFASCPGVSKVGSYTGNGTSQTINCGFTSGARFILIKRTDSTGDWYVWDTARGIVAANDPHLSLNTTAAEVTTNDSVDPDNSGFIVNQVSATNINVNAASYIYLAIA